MSRNMLSHLYRYVCKLIQKPSTTAVPQSKILQYHGKDSPGLRSGSRIHRKVCSRVSFSFSSQLIFFFLLYKTTQLLDIWVLFTLCLLNKYRKAWAKLHVSVALINHASSPKLFNHCHARPCRLIIACCIFISTFEKLLTNGSCIFVKEEIWNIDLRAIFLPLSLSCFCRELFCVENPSYLIAFFLNTGIEKDWLIW